MFNIAWNLWRIKLITGRRHCDGALVRPSMEHNCQHCSNCAIFTAGDVWCHATLHTILLKFIDWQAKKCTQQSENNRHISTEYTVFLILFYRTTIILNNKRLNMATKDLINVKCYCNCWRFKTFQIILSYLNFKALNVKTDKRKGFFFPLAFSIRRVKS